jgi:ATPase subunit of ABC transporter with duplicated ATPase domains
MLREDMMNRSMDLTQRAGVQNGSLSDNLNSTYNTSFLGIAPPSGAYVAMMEAKFEKDQKRLQMMRMEARLKKLQTDEEKVARQISEARKKQDFIMNMKNEKERQARMKADHQERLRMQEEENRRRFNDERFQTKKQIHDNLRRKYTENHMAGEDIK